MARLIDADALIAELDKFSNPMPNESGYDFLCGIATAITEVEEAPTVEVVHGRWKRRGRNLGECSECGEIVMVRYPYCPNCGAKMDKQEDEHESNES